MKIMYFHFFHTVKVDTVYQKVLNNSYLLLFLRLHCDFIYYTENVFLSENVIFL